MGCSCVNTIIMFVFLLWRYCVQVLVLVELLCKSSQSNRIIVLCYCASSVVVEFLCLCVNDVDSASLNWTFS